LLEAIQGVGKVGQRRAAAARERVPLGHDQLVPVFAQLGELELRGEHAGRRVVVVDKGEVNLAGLELGARLRGLGLEHAQLNLRMALVEGRDGARNQSGAGALEADQAQPAAA
jgi:hypothetical protein